MPLTWDYINKGEDTAPEILLQASGSSKGEQIMLFQILQGFYGNPVVLEGTSANGFASEVVIGFDNTGQVGINNVMNKLNDSSFKISWTNNNYREVVKEQTTVKIKSIMVDIPEWNLIKNLKPTLVVERYKPAKYRGLNSNQQREYRASGFRQSNEPGLPSEFILSKQSGSVNILQEKLYQKQTELFASENSNTRLKQKNSELTKIISDKKNSNSSKQTEKTKSTENKKPSFAFLGI